MKQFFLIISVFFFSSYGNASDFFIPKNVDFFSIGDFGTKCYIKNKKIDCSGYLRNKIDLNKGLVNPKKVVSTWAAICILDEVESNKMKVKCKGDHSWSPIVWLEKINDIELENPIDLSITTNYGCAVLKKGGVECWGWDNDIGIIKNAPADPSFKTVDMDLHHACSLSRKDGIFCWGTNRYLQLNVPKIENVSLVIAMKNSAIAFSNGRIIGWGEEGFVSFKTLPKYQKLLSVAHDSFYGCLLNLKNDNEKEIKCWGRGFDNEEKGDPVPTEVTNPLKLYAGGKSVCAKNLEKNGDQVIYCWKAWNKK